MTGEDERIETVLPLVAKHGAAVVAITNDETGISEDPDVRFGIAEKIVHAAADHGVPAQDVVVDPLVMPIGAMRTAGSAGVPAGAPAARELGVNTTCGASNVSSGCRTANGINGAFLSMAIASGMTRAITSPLHEEVKRSTMAADVLMGNRRARGGWIRRYADRAAAAAAEGAGRRRGGRAAPGRPTERGMSAPARTIVFTPSGRRGEVPDGASVLDAARALGVDLDSVCGGRGICGRCQVVPMEGSFPKHGLTSAADHLIPFTEPEERYRERDGLAADRRLGCHAKICGDLVVDVPPESQIHRQVVRKEADAHPIDVDPIVRLHYVEVEEPTLATAGGDLERLLAALERDWDLAGLDVDPVVLPGLQQTLRAGAWTATVAVRDGSLITAVFPGFHDVALGVAFDVGSTTVAGHLCDLHTARCSRAPAR